MKQIRWNNIFYNTCLACNSMLLFLALFGAQMQVPAWLQVTGRMHPMLLHFPIVLLVLAVVWETAVPAKDNPLYRQTGNALLLASALSAALSALMGLFLSNEGGYEEQTLLWHKWSGVATAFITFAWYIFRERVRQSKMRGGLTAALAVAVVTLAGHLGATLTHGDNYLLQPVFSGKTGPQITLEDALVFRDLVRPVLEAKCMSCHNARKSKGDLVMETEASLLKGGKNGVLWDSTAEQFGRMMQRIHLPIAEKEHMPPQGKTQLTEDEIRILYFWIKSGASFTQKIVDLPENDSLRILAAGRFQPLEMEQYSFPAADESTIRNLNNDYRVVHPLALQSPALAVDFFGIAAFKSEYLQELKGIKEQVVQLNLNKMPVQDADLKTIATFPNLRKLNLSATAITGATLGELKPLKALRQLSLSNTAVKAADLEVLSELPDLSVLFLWNTGVTESELTALQQRFPHIRFESGFSGKDVVAKLNAAVIEGDADVFDISTKVRLKNYIKGAVVRYTLDGSVPDSLRSPISTGDSITIDKTCLLSTKTFLPGWVSSEVATRNFYKAGLIPDSIALIYPPNPQYRAEGPKTLINKVIGDTEFKTNNRWLGYRETNLECLLFFKEPTTLSSVYVSTLAHIGSYIMPPAEIQVWGGTHTNNLVLLEKIRPEQPTKLAKYRVGYSCDFKVQKMKVLKIVLKPVKKLPPWHPQKGEPGWVFMDEVFLN
ncbi:MAG: chitobiase/beta-hexosaminidase C-terminal domain-containing protein [Saprospiraceae bacterium]|nr:chitobiase/beta-hexosaminidase C-terminal domain-containing protein [Saprospiraceae bacterium]